MYHLEQSTNGHSGQSSMRVIRATQRLLFVIGLLLTIIYLAAYIHRTTSSYADLKRFEEARAASSVRSDAERDVSVDYSLWSEKRIRDYQESLAMHLQAPSAVLRIPKVHLEVAVLEGTDDVTLNRAVGHIAGTGAPGTDGNVGIAGHRDGFFRVLKDIVPGDQIELLTSQGTNRYVVDHIALVQPNNVSVLRPRSGPSLTLVTCYPFYYIGSAPQRYIVEATIAHFDARKTGGSNGSELQTLGHAARTATQYTSETATRN